MRKIVLGFQDDVYESLVAAWKATENQSEFNAEYFENWCRCAIKGMALIMLAEYNKKEGLL